MKQFQRDNGLKVDGLMRPGGPTESAIGRNLMRVSSSGGSDDSILDNQGKTPYDPYSRGPNYNVGINDWDGVARFVGEGDKTTVGTCGPLRVEAYPGGSVSGDEVHYSLKWYSRDKNGKTIPVMKVEKPKLPHTFLIKLVVGSQALLTIHHLSKQKKARTIP